MMQVYRLNTGLPYQGACSVPGRLTVQETEKHCAGAAAGPHGVN
jgi:hypothetical protein